MRKHGKFKARADRQRRKRNKRRGDKYGAVGPHLPRNMDRDGLGLSARRSALGKAAAA